MMAPLWPGIGIKQIDAVQGLLRGSASITARASPLKRRTLRKDSASISARALAMPFKKASQPI